MHMLIFIHIIYHPSYNPILYYNICSMLNKIAEIKADLKEARNFAYLGKYQQSQKLFKCVIDSI